MQPTCKSCHFQVSDNFYFCPNCGKKLKEPPITIGKQIGIYLLSILLPPLGLLPGIRYLLQKDKKTRMVGLIAIILTVISVLVSIWIFTGIIANINQSINQSLNSQLNQDLNSQLNLLQ